MHLVALRAESLNEGAQLALVGPDHRQREIVARLHRPIDAALADAAAFRVDPARVTTAPELRQELFRHVGVHDQRPQFWRDAREAFFPFNQCGLPRRWRPGHDPRLPFPPHRAGPVQVVGEA